MTMVPWDQLSPPRYFTRGELSCRHCGDCYLDPVAVQYLDELRHRAGFPLHCNSGYRCPSHNRSVGGALHSLHLKGQAFDIWLPSEPKRSYVAFLAARVGFSAIGVYRSFLHLDIGSARFWSGSDVREPESPPPDEIEF